MNKRVINVGLIGLGTVGRGVARMLTQKHAMLLKKTGFDFRLKTVCVRHPRKKRGLRLGRVRVTGRVNDILDDPAIDQVVELMGGIRPALNYIKRALERGKDVVSANKALFAERGLEVHRLAQKKHRHLGLEASVGGGLPVVKSLKEGLAANRIQSVCGILNGTCNAILTDMSRRRRSYRDALNEAQARGWAEKDPTLDVSGADTAHKLAILARIAFQREIDFSRIVYEGIDRIAPVDIRYADTMGYTVKLVAVARRAGAELELRVHPALLPEGHLLAGTHGVHNALVIRGDEAGDVLIYGKGAGERPTASAVVGDMIDLAKLRALDVDPYQKIFERAVLRKPADIESRYYIRLHLRDKKGTLSLITRQLGARNISLSTVHQIENPHTTYVPVILITHRCRERDLRAVVASLARTPSVREKPVVIRVEN